MKKIYIPILAAALTAPALLLTGCIEETIPTDRVTQEKVIESPNGTASYALGMPAFLNTAFVLGNSKLHYDFGYPSMMHIRDVMTGDMPIQFSKSGYDWFTAWENNEHQAQDNIYPQLIWNTYNQQVLTANLTLSSIDITSEHNTPIKKYYYGAALAYRAFAYLDMARMFEYLPTDATSPMMAGGNVTGLTVPIVTENMDEQQARQNPRATHEEMMTFLINDLTEAEKYISEAERPSKTMPDLACVYGLMARAYMWDNDYANAKKYARMAISSHNGSPTTEAQWLSKDTGFNNLATPAWMWGGQYTSEDYAIRTNLINWTSWVCNEFDGYSGAEPRLKIDANLYHQISDDDFRKLTFVAPKGSALEGKENYINKAFTDSWEYGPLEELASLKFKPNQANMTNADPGCVTAFPLMRVEEMYFIEAEAAAHLNAAEGKQLLESFMQTYRYSTYTCNATNINGVVDECFLQKRIELYGEGQSFFDYKRLDKPVTRHYNGTNWNEACQFNTTTRPAWMNIVIVMTEQNNNHALIGFNNPDPTGCYENLAAGAK